MVSTPLLISFNQVVDQELQMMSVRGDNKKSMAAMKDVFLRIKPFVEPKEEVPAQVSSHTLLGSTIVR